MDNIDRIIIVLLTQDSRRSLADIGTRVGLSPSAVNERLRRLVASGAIRRFTVAVDAQALDLRILAFIWIALPERADEAAFRAHAAADPQIEECHHVTGDWSYLVKMRTGSLADLEAFLAALKAQGFVGRSQTVLALSSPVPGAFVPPTGG